MFSSKFGSRTRRNAFSSSLFEVQVEPIEGIPTSIDSKEGMLTYL